MTNPFENKLWRMVSNETEDEGLPCFVAAAQIFLIHGRGAYETFMKRSPKITHIQMADCDYYPWPNRESSGKILAFLDRYLNDADNDLESVGIQMRLGHKGVHCIGGKKPIGPFQTRNIPNGISKQTAVWP